MGLTNFPNGITSMGFPVIGSGPYMTSGNVFFVHNVTGSNGNNGKSTNKPFASIDYAVGRCKADKGDIIFPMPGHVETIIAAAGIDLDVAGISIIGLGNGTNRPTINFTTAAAADMDIDAANISIENIYFDMTGVDAVVAGIDINSANFTMKNCDILMADSGGQAVLAILLDANADDCKILGCKFVGPNTGADAAIRISGTPTNVEIGYCRIDGDFADACIHNPIGNIATQLDIHNCYLKNDQTGDHSLELVSACTGSLTRNTYHNNMTQATGVDPGSCFSFECYHCDAVDVSGILAPAAT